MLCAWDKVPCKSLDKVSSRMQLRIGNSSVKEQRQPRAG